MGGNEKNGILVAVSDFARTLTPNSSAGSDHAWGGNYFMTGGSVKGGRIVGKWPADLDGPLNVDGPEGRGRIIPSTSWDAIWNSVCQHMGVTEETDLDYLTKMIYLLQSKKKLNALSNHKPIA